MHNHAMHRVFGVLLACTVAVLHPVAPGTTAVRVWGSSTTIPTYAEGAASANPPFDPFTFGRVNHPYPIRDALTDTREPVAWRSLHLENENLRTPTAPPESPENRAIC